MDQSWRAVPVPWQTRWRHRFLFLLLLAGLLLLGCLAYEPIREALDLRSPQPPGRVVQADGLDLHMQVIGPPAKPAVVLFDDWGQPSSSWGWVMAGMPKAAMAVRWDPPGYAWSALGRGPYDAGTEAQHIHQMMNAYEIQGPYLLVGKGFGAVEARAFAVRFPDEVAGMVLIDSWHPSLMGDTAAMAKDLDHEARMRRFSFHRLSAWWHKEPVKNFGLPPNDEDAFHAARLTMKLPEVQADELRALPQSFEEIQANQTMGSKPLVVITTAALDAGEAGNPWAANAQASRIQLDEVLSQLSTQGKHIILPGATPNTLLNHAESADQIVQAIQQVLGH